MSDPKKLFNNLWLAITARADAGWNKNGDDWFIMLIEHIYVVFLFFQDALRDETASIDLDLFIHLLIIY